MRSQPDSIVYSTLERSSIWLYVLLVFAEIIPYRVSQIYYLSKKKKIVECNHDQNINVMEMFSQFINVWIFV